ncbi:MAG: DNA replication and repair protein RecF [Balneolaceae bacterium]
MILDRLSIQQFRNHTETTVDLAPRINVFTGQNGAGKTSLIDAIHYLCMSRSFVSSSDRYVVQTGETWFMLEGMFRGNIRSEFRVGCSYDKGEGKKIFVNRSPLDRFSDLIGMVPVVVLSPEDRKLTDEGPVWRRSFLDGFISQLSTSYLRDLIHYQRVRKQRNRVLQQLAYSSSLEPSMLDPWDQQLVRFGSRLMIARHHVIQRLQKYLANQYEALSGMEHRPNLVYQTLCDASRSPDEVESDYHKILSESRERELEREQTLTGPHRDEVVFFLGDMELRNYGSQGQHRLFTIALKLAQLFYYSDELDDLPLMLLDDVFGNLDKATCQLVLEMLQHHPGQIFITSASESPFEQMSIDWSGNNSWFLAEGGAIHRRET